MKSPVIFFSGNTVVRAGNVVVVRGEYLDTVTKATLSDGTQTEEIELYQLNRQSFKFAIPEGFAEGLYTLVLSGEFGSVERTLNLPVIRWIQGDEGAISTPEGWFRVQGECLRICADRQLSVRIKGSDTELTLEPEYVFDDYSVKFKVPSLAEGKYEIFYSNGFAEASSEITVGACPEDEWSKKVFHAFDYGFRKDTIGDCTESLRIMLDEARKNGGGIIYIPHGRYRMRGTFRVPPNTVIRGDGYKRTQIFWSDEWSKMENGHWMPDKTPEYIFYLEGDNAFEDIDIEARRLGNLFRSYPWESTKKNYRFDRIRVQVNPMTGDEMHVRFGQDKWEARAAVLKEQFSCRTDLMNVTGENVKIRDCIFNWGGRVFGDHNGMKYFLMQNNVFGDCTAVDDWMPIGHIEQALIEDNEIRHWTSGAAGRNMYFARNKILNVEDNNREAFTTDVALGMTYYGPVKTEGNRYIFPEGIRMDRVEPGKTLCILEGTGAGQFMRVTKVDGTTVECEHEFEVQPDETSKLIVNTSFENFYFIDLIIHNSGSLQLYTAEINTVVDNVQFTHSASIKAWGQFVYDTISELWYTTFQNCSLSDGNYYHMFGWYMDPHLPGNTFMCAFGEGDVCSNICTVMRNNTFVDDALINLRGGDNMSSMQDVVIEGNEFTDCKRAIFGEHFMERVFVYGNKYTRVDYIAEFKEPKAADEAMYVNEIRVEG